MEYNYGDDDFDAFDETYYDIIKKVLIPWNTFSAQKKLSHFSKHSCHELNFFLFKRDKEFFDSAVKVLI